jgi:hypothetical protein
VTTAISVALGALASAAVAGGCSLTTDFASLDSDKGAASGDGGPTADGAGPGDGGDGGGSTEGGTTSEAGAEGGTSPCSQPHTLCADFDVGAYDKGWKRQTITGGGTLALDDRALSPPHSLRATQPRRQAGASGTVSELNVNVGGAWRRVVVEADLFLTTPAWQADDVNFALIHIGLYSAQNSGTVLFVTPGGCFGTIEHLSEPARNVLLDAVPYDRWVHVVVDFDPGGTIHYQIDGKSFDRTFAAVTFGPAPAMEVDLGVLDYNSPAPAIDLRWDNVTIDLP